MNKVAMGIVLALAVGSTTALAEEHDAEVTSDDRNGLSVSLGGGTLGAGAEVSYRFNDRFGMRVPFGTASASHDEESDGETYAGDIDIGGVGLMADYYPTGGAFRISGGVFNTDYSASLEGRNIDVGGTTADIFVDVEQKESLAPALALGWDAPILGSRASLNVSAGALFGQGFDVRASSPTAGVSQGDVDAEIADIRDTASDIDIIPYGQLMIGLRF